MSLYKVDGMYMNIRVHNDFSVVAPGLLSAIDKLNAATNLEEMTIARQAVAEYARLLKPIIKNI